MPARFNGIGTDDESQDFKLFVCAMRYAMKWTRLYHRSKWLFRLIPLIAAVMLPGGIYAQTIVDISVATEGSNPWASYAPNLGDFVAWENLADAIHLRRIDSSGVLDSDTISLASTSASLFPRVCANAHFAAAIWEDRESNIINSQNTYITGYSFPLDSIHAGNYLILNSAFGDAVRTKPDADFLNDTTLVAVWSGNGPLTPSPQNGIYGQMYTVRGGLIGGNLLLTDHAQSAVNGFGPRVLTHMGGGDFVVTWVDSSMGSSKLFGRIFNSAGAALAPSFLISTDSAMTDMYYYGVAQDSTGGFVACWIADIDTVSRIEWRWFDKNATPLSETRSVSGDTKLFRSGNCIDVSIDEQSRAMLVWEQNTSRGTKIFGQPFRNNQSSFRAPFRISNDTSLADEIFPRVVFRHNSIRTVWESNGVKASEIDFGTVASIGSYATLGKDSRSFELYPNYPNPFNPSTSIRYALPERARVTLTVFNTLGQRVATLVDAVEEPGEHSVRYEGNGIASGVYYYRLRAGGYARVMKLLLIR